MGSFWNDHAPHAIRARAATIIRKGCLSAKETSLAIMVSALLDTCGELHEEAAVGQHALAFLQSGGDRDHAVLEHADGDGALGEQIGLRLRSGERRVGGK